MFTLLVPWFIARTLGGDQGIIFDLSAENEKSAINALFLNSKTSLT